jgi:hypothetical protein
VTRHSGGVFRWIAFVLVIVFLVVMLGAFQRMRREK